MPTEYEGIRHVVHISTHIGKHCEHCPEWIGTERFAGAINHYIQVHAYRLLHIGTETDRDAQGKPYHTTIAVVGK
jgi:hypothetical protein